MTLAHCQRLPLVLINSMQHSRKGLRMTINVPELRKQLEFLTANRDKHEQNVWYSMNSTMDVEYIYHELTDSTCRVLREDAIWKCGTTACLAGWTAMSHGWRPVTNSGTHMYRDGEFNTAFHVGQEILGLDRSQAHALFSGTRDLRGLWREANIMTNGEIEIPEEFK